MTHTPSIHIAIALTLITAIAAAAQPNVVLIITDDQGYGDLGATGNPIVRTPNIDALFAESARFTRFYVSPVCAPTRASLMTGRYNYRTGVTDTFLGRAMMDPKEVTIAEILRDRSYATGIFGKWHLGDDYPLRPMDQGFTTSLIHKGGGINQPSDPPEGSSYTDPVVYRNGHEERAKGYCSNVWTDGAIQFIDANRDKPFFCYLSFNAPHSPFNVPDEYAAPYRKLNMKVADFPGPGNPIPPGFSAEVMANVYGMITNIDDNVGRVLRKLDELGLRENTILIFMTDNGPATPRYNAGLRGIKGSTFEGGIRTSFALRWPAKIKTPSQVGIVSAHIDIAPTLVEACEATTNGVKFDGHSFVPAIDITTSASLVERTLYFQWHRGDAPQLYRAFSAVGAQYKIVQAEGSDGNAKIDPNKIMLFDLHADPYERHDLAKEKPDIVAAMRLGYEQWLADVSATRGYDPVRIIIGTEHQDPVTLTRQDWRGPRAGWGADSQGNWEVEFATEGPYEITLHFPAVAVRTEPPTSVRPEPVEGRAALTIGPYTAERPLAPGATTATFTNVRVQPGPNRIEPTITTGPTPRGPHYVEIKSH